MTDVAKLPGTSFYFIVARAYDVIVPELNFKMRLSLCCGVYVHVPFTRKEEPTHISGTTAHELGQPTAIDPRTGRARDAKL